MMKNKLFSLVVVVLIIIGCQNDTENIKDGTRLSKVVEIDSLSINYVEDIKEQFLNKVISTKIVINGFEVRDTIFEGDEGAYWPAKIYYKNDALSFYLEANWFDTTRVSRIVILDSTICTLNGVCVGHSIADKNLFNPRLPAEPDGYLSIAVKADSSIFCFLDISNNSELNEGAKDISLLPDSLRIEYFVIQ